MFVMIFVVFVVPPNTERYSIEKGVASYFQLVVLLVSVGLVVSSVMNEQPPS